MSCRWVKVWAECLQYGNGYGGLYIGLLTDGGISTCYGAQNGGARKFVVQWSLKVHSGSRLHGM